MQRICTVYVNSNTAAMCHSYVCDLEPAHLKKPFPRPGQKSKRKQSAISIDVPENDETNESPATPLTPHTPLLGPDIYSGDCNVSAEQRQEDCKRRVSMPPLKSIWECEHMNKCKVDDHDGWQCGWYEKSSSRCTLHVHCFTCSRSLTKALQRVGLR